MSESLDNLKRLLDECTDEERAALLDYLKTRLPQHSLENEWGVGAEVILSLNSEVGRRFHKDSWPDFGLSRGLRMQLRRSWNTVG